MKMPAAWSSAPTAQSKQQAKASKEATKVTARIDMSEEVAGAGLCPDCRQPMQPMMAGEIETLTCMPCRISIPTKDPEEVPRPDVLEPLPAGEVQNSDAAGNAANPAEKQEATMGPSTAQDMMH